MSKQIGRVLIANRGEIAIRIARACSELGIESVAVYSDADADALHVAAADRSEHIGPAPAVESYLAVDAVLAAAARSGADAVHPGYGFMSEDARFARAVERAGLVWIGPPPETLEHLGNKVAARASAVAAGVPVVPGFQADAGSDPLIAAEALGYPLMIKAAAGGGGRGMRRVERREELERAFQVAGREAEAAFGDGTVYVERLLSEVRHVEVQLLGDRHGHVVCLGERDCSVQRRHQKLLEESPSPAVGPALREALFDSALKVAGSVPFHNAATAEFLIDREGSHYFLELNARLQVEHGVTELVTGLDLVGLQIRLAAGERLPEEARSPEPRGHAVEVRLYAEDPYDGFRPAPGRIGAWQMPSGPGVRVDAGVDADTDLPAEYDPLLAKLMVHAGDRALALRRLRRALDETLIGGVQTGLGFFHWLLDEPGFSAGDYATELVATRWGNGPPLDSVDADAAVALAVAARRTGDSVGDATGRRPGSPPAAGHSPWQLQARREGLRDGGRGAERGAGGRP